MHTVTFKLSRDK